MPSLAAVLITRQAISPRLAIRIFLNINNHHPDDTGSLAPVTAMIGAKAGRTIEDAKPQPANPPRPRQEAASPAWTRKLASRPVRLLLPSGRHHRCPLNKL